MFCNQCGSRIQEGDLFCGGCGAKLKSTEESSVSAGPHAKRPIGLSIVAIYLAIGALTSIPGCIYSFSQSQVVLPALWKVSTMVGTLNQLLGAPAGYGLWNRQKWGLALAKMIFGINIPLGLVLYLLSFRVGVPGSASSFNVGIVGASMLSGIAFSILILWYLSKPEIKRSFG